MDNTYRGHLNATLKYMLDYIKTNKLGPLPDNVSINDFRSDLTYIKKYTKKKGIDISADIKKIRLFHRKK